MSRNLLWLLVILAVSLAGIVCFVFLPISRLAAVPFFLVSSALLTVVLFVAFRHPGYSTAFSFPGLPEEDWSLPVVLVCGDLPQIWPDVGGVVQDLHGLWIRVDDGHDAEEVAHRLLRIRPRWGRQLSVMLQVCPQQHVDAVALTRRLQRFREQVSHLRRRTGHDIPFILSCVTGTRMADSPLWQSVMPDGVVRLHDVCTAGCVDGGHPAMTPPLQVLMNRLTAWTEEQVYPHLTSTKDTVCSLEPEVLLCCLRPDIEDVRPHSLWTVTLQQHTALKYASGWVPAAEVTGSVLALPDFIFTLLPEGRGLTPVRRAVLATLTLLVGAGGISLCCSAWNNHQLLQKVAFDIHRYDRTAMDDYTLKAETVNILKQDAGLLDEYARSGAPLSLGLGLYHGSVLRMPLLNAIRSYIPPPPPSSPSRPEIIRLDSMSLFDSGKAQLKSGSTKLLVNSLVGIKARPGWLIVVSGHTDSEGNDRDNQLLSLKRAEAVRDWMRDTGDVPGSCFAVQGYGESRPVATNETPEGRAANRRVEISLVPQADACRQPDTKPASPDVRDVSTR